MKQFVLKFENVDKDIDQLENHAPMGYTCLSPTKQKELIEADPVEVFIQLSDKRDPNYIGLTKIVGSKLPSTDYNTIALRRSSGVLLTHYNEKERSLQVHFSLDPDHDSRQFNTSFYSILECYIGLPEDVRKGQLLYTNNKEWAVTAYFRRLTNPDTGEVATLDAYRKLRLQDVSYLTSPDSHMRELREAVLYWVNHEYAHRLKWAIESDIKTQQLILNTKP